MLCVKASLQDWRVTSVDLIKYAWFAPSVRWIIYSVLRQNTLGMKFQQWANQPDNQLTKVSLTLRLSGVVSSGPVRFHLFRSAAACYILVWSVFCRGWLFMLLGGHFPPANRSYSVIARHKTPLHSAELSRMLSPIHNERILSVIRLHARCKQWCTF